MCVHTNRNWTYARDTCCQYSPREKLIHLDVPDLGHCEIICRLESHEAGLVVRHGELREIRRKEEREQCRGVGAEFGCDGQNLVDVSFALYSM